MNTQEFLNKIIEIKDTALATISLDGRPSNRIIDMMYMEDNCLYFLTARGKNLYRELLNKPYVSVTVCKQNKAYSLYGYVEIVDRKYLKVLFDHNRFMYGTYPGETSKVLEVFRIYSWNGEFFDLTKKPIYRQSFQFNSKETKEVKYQIDKTKCVTCGKCMKVCPQKCIDLDSKIIHENNCLRCGACLEICPVKAVNII